MKRSVILILLIFSVLTMFSQRAYFDKKEITVGDRADLTLEISGDAGKNIQFPVFDKELIPGVEIVNQSAVHKDKKDNFLKQTITVTAFDDSLFLIKGLKFIVDGDTLTSNPVKLKVNYFKPDSAFISKIDTTQKFKIADIKAPKDAPMTFKEFMHRFGLYISVILFLTILIFFIIRYIRKRKIDNKPLFIKEKPKIPAHVKAIERLNKLKKKNLHKKDDLKPFYTEMSNIIRAYTEERFNIPAPEQVTSEIIENFEQTDYASDDLKNKLRELLSLSDTVKFAKNKPDEYENEIMFEYAYNFIEKTKPAEHAEQENPDDGEDKKELK